MIKKEQQAIQIKSSEGKHYQGTLTFATYDKNARLKRAFSIFGLCWLLACISLFIPIAHWFLVPSFLIAGPVMAVGRYKMTSANENVEGKCPVCDNDITIELDASDTLPKWTYCPICNKSIQLIEET